MNTPTKSQLPNRRWLTRAMVIEYLGGSRHELERLERERLVVPEFPGGCKRKHYVRSQVIAAVQGN